MMTGIRVVELATVVAVPTVGRMFTDLGAEVIKIETTGAMGDMWRNFFLEFEQHGSDTEEGKPRRWSSLFEVVNLGKASVQLDYMSPEGISNSTRNPKLEPYPIWKASIS